MKRMVKNGDLIDVEPDGSITVAGKPIGGGGENEREIKLIMPYPSSDTSSQKKIYVDNEIYQKINNYFYETIKVYYNDGNPTAIFHVVNINDAYNSMNAKIYVAASNYDGTYTTPAWFGSNQSKYPFTKLTTAADSKGKYVRISGHQPLPVPSLSQSKFDALYKLADKPTQDGTYVLKATVSGGAVTYTWVAQ